MELIPIQYRLAAGVVALAAIVGVSAWGGWTIRDRAARLADAERTAVEQTRLAEALTLERRSAEQMQQHVAAVDLAAATRQEKIRTIYRTINKEVIRYVQNQDIERCALSADWRVLHDSAAVGELPEAAFADGLFVGGAGEVDDAAAIETVVANYEECGRWKEQVIGWQTWYRALSR